MTGFEGMDVGEVQSLSGRLDGQVGSLNSVIDLVDRVVGALPDVWAGDDLEAFVAGWHREYRPGALAAAENLKALGKNLHTQIEQQNQASEVAQPQHHSSGLFGFIGGGVSFVEHVSSDGLNDAESVGNTVVGDAKDVGKAAVDGAVDVGGAVVDSAKDSVKFVEQHRGTIVDDAELAALNALPGVGAVADIVGVKNFNHAVGDGVEFAAQHPGLDAQLAALIAVNAIPVLGEGADAAVGSELVADTAEAATDAEAATTAATADASTAAEASEASASAESAASPEAATEPAPTEPEEPDNPFELSGKAKTAIVYGAGQVTNLATGHFTASGALIDGAFSIYGPLADIPGLSEDAKGILENFDTGATLTGMGVDLGIDEANKHEKP